MSVHVRRDACTCCVAPRAWLAHIVFELKCHIRVMRILVLVRDRELGRADAAGRSWHARSTLDAKMADPALASTAPMEVVSTSDVSPYSSTQPRHAKRSYSHTCVGGLGGCVAGISIAILSTVIFTASLPTCDPLPVQNTLTIQFGLILLLSIAGSIIGCCCCRCESQRRTPMRWCWFGAVLVLVVSAAGGLASPSSSSLRVRLAWSAAYGLINPSQRPQLPPGYCDAASRAAESGWLAARASEPPSQLAASLVTAMTVEEVARLVQGVGWDGWTQKRGYYMGNVLGVPRLGLPSLHMHDAGQGFRTTEVCSKALKPQSSHATPLKGHRSSLS